MGRLPVLMQSEIIPAVAVLVGTISQLDISSPHE